MFRTAFIFAALILPAAAFSDSGVTTQPAQTASERLMQFAQENKELKAELAAARKQISDLQTALAAAAGRPSDAGKWEVKVGMTLDEATRIAKASTQNKYPAFEPQLSFDNGETKGYVVAVWNGPRETVYNATVDKSGKITAIDVSHVDLSVSGRPTVRPSR